MAESLQIFFKLFGLFVTLFMIYLLVAGSVTLALYTRIGQGDPKGFWYTDREKLNKYIFKSWIAWAGSPSTFSMKEKVELEREIFGVRSQMPSHEGVTPTFTMIAGVTVVTHCCHG